MIKVLDVTLRDGGCVNNFNFGQTCIKNILEAQENAGIDIIELGYIDEKNGSVAGRTQYINEKVIAKNVILHKIPHATYIAMVDYGKFNLDNLGQKRESDIDGIRLAFHKENKSNIASLGRRIIEKGYKLYIQPMVTSRYCDDEILELINIVNEELPETEAFYIVDSFGEMYPDDIIKIINIIDYYLDSDIALGLHSHNNQMMSYSNAIAMLQFPLIRDVILDCSIMGMGKGAGNLNTELLLKYLNTYYKKEYQIAPLLKVSDKIITQLRSEFYWGYAPEYYVSAINRCSPSYARYFHDRYKLSIDQVNEILGKIEYKQRVSFDKNYAEDIYLQYKSENKKSSRNL